MRRIKKRTRQSKFIDSEVNLVPLTLIILVATITYHGFTGGEDNRAYGLVITTIRYIAYLLAFFLFFSRPQRAIRIKNTPPLLILGLYFIISILWSQNTNIVTVNFIHFVGTGLSAFLAAQFFLSSNSPIIKAYWPTLLFVALLPSLLVVLLLPEFAGPSNLDELGEAFDDGRWAGVSGSPNILGVECVIAIWAATTGLYSSPGKKLKILCFSLLIIAIVLLLGSQSASSLVSSILVVSLIIFFSKYSKISKEKRKQIILGLSYLFAIAAIILVFILPSIVSVDSTTQALGRDSTFTGRTLLWGNAKELISLKPILGWGFDNRTAAKDVIWMEVNHYHNGYLDMMVRGGMVGFCILAFMYIWYIYKVLLMKSDTFQRNTPYIAILLTALVYNIGEVAFASWTHAMWVLLMFSLFMVTKTQKRKPNKSVFVVTPRVRKRSIFTLPKKRRKRRRRKITRLMGPDCNVASQQYHS